MNRMIAADETPTVIGYVLKRLRELGITEVFGVPGDYSFPVCDAICAEPGMRWVGCSNELNAGYAADGYARVRGAGAVCTTYGVGELSAINAIAGAYAEHLPLFHLVGMPGMQTQASRALMHHTLGNGEYSLYQRMSEPVVCAHAVMTPQNVARETERLIAEALYHRRPVYMAFPADLAVQPVLDRAEPAQPPGSDPVQLARAVEAITCALEQAPSACLLPGILVDRVGARDALQALVDATDLPFATMFMAKSVLDEAQPNYVGIYDGRLMNERVRAFVESVGRAIVVGSPMTDFNTGAFTANLPRGRTIVIGHHHAVVDGRRYPNVEMGELIAALATRLPRRDWRRPAPEAPAEIVGEGSEAISAGALYPRLARFIQPGDTVVAETGTVSMGAGFSRLPAGARFFNQTLWGSIGWATPAALGAAVAAKQQRVVLLTGEGSHQMTVQAIGQFSRLGLKPVVIVLNNDGYLIERLLCADPSIAYNDVAPWRYADIPRAFGGDDWYTARATTCTELDDALARASLSDCPAYIEVVTDAYAASELADQLGAGLKALRAEETAR